MVSIRRGGLRLGGLRVGSGGGGSTPSPSAPANYIKPSIFGTPEIGNTLVVNPGSWGGYPSPALSRAWLLNGVASGIVGNSYTVQSGDLGKSITCRETGLNASGSVNSTSDPVGPVTAPVVLTSPGYNTAPSITGSGVVGGTLTRVAGTYTGNPSPTITWVWQADGVTVQTGGATYSPVSGDVSKSITVRETATNSQGSVSRSSAGVAISAAPAGTFNIVSAPTILGDARVGQTLLAQSGTYSSTADSFVRQWTLNGVAVTGAEGAGDSFQVLDIHVGKTIGYSEIGVKAGYSNTASNPATATGAVVHIGDSNGIIPNAITALTRTSSSGGPFTWTVSFGSNVYAGYGLRLQVFPNQTLLASERQQDVYYQLAAVDLQPGADMSARLAAAGLGTIGATQWLHVSVLATSPNGLGFRYDTAPAISPTNVPGDRYWKFNISATQDGTSTIRDLAAALTAGGTNVVAGHTNYYSNGYQASGSFASSRIIDNNLGTLGRLDPASGFPQWLVIDFGSPVDLHELRLDSFSGFEGGMPTVFQFGPCAAPTGLTPDAANAGTGPAFSSTPVNVTSGVTWSGSQQKTWSW